MPTSAGMAPLTRALVAALDASAAAHQLPGLSFKPGAHQADVVAPYLRRHWHTPAMTAGTTDQRCSVDHLLAFHVPSPRPASGSARRWILPKRRGRVPKATHVRITRWCSWPGLAGVLPDQFE